MPINSSSQHKSKRKKTKPESKNFALRAPKELMKEVESLSREENRSTNSQIVHMLQKLISTKSTK